MAKCKVCGENSRGDYCFRHKRRKQIKQSPLRKKPSTRKEPRNDTSQRGRKAHKVKRASVKQLKVRLDIIFSQFIRLRYADYQGMVTCFTSGEVLFWRASQCGHFMSRKHNNTRWNELNCQVQTVAQNVFRHGEQYIFGKNLDSTYGEGTADELVRLSKEDFKLTIEWLKDKIDHYTKEVTRLKHEKGL